jgi:sarcosine oxidase subunit beta
MLVDDSVPTSASVVIVGGGIAGLSLAHELAIRGRRDIVVVERGYPGSGASGRNVARIRAMQLTEELCDIASHCQAKYDGMGDTLGVNILFYRMGYAWVLYDADEVERMRATVEMHHRVGIQSVLLDQGGTLDAIPVLRGGDQVAGSVVHNDAIVHHDVVVWAYLESIARRGVRCIPHTTVMGIRRGENGIQAVETSRGVIETSEVVNATGAWSGAFSALAGVDAPNRPYRREVLVTAPIEPLIDKAVTFYRPHEGWFNQTLRGEVVMGAVDTVEPAALNQQSSFAFLRRTASLMVRKAPALADLSAIRQWAGLYDITPDHQPLVGPTSQLPGWWQMNGWSGRGVLLGPYSAELLAKRMAQGLESIPAIFSPDRFARGSAAPEMDHSDYYGRYALSAKS